MRIEFFMIRVERFRWENRGVSSMFLVIRVRDVVVVRSEERENGRF